MQLFQTIFGSADFSPSRTGLHVYTCSQSLVFLQSGLGWSLVKVILMKRLSSGKFGILCLYLCLLQLCRHNTAQTNHVSSILANNAAGSWRSSSAWSFPRLHSPLHMLSQYLRCAKQGLQLVDYVRTSFGIQSLQAAAGLRFILRPLCISASANICIHAL